MLQSRRGLGWEKDPGRQREGGVEPRLPLAPPQGSGGASSSQSHRIEGRQSLPGKYLHNIHLIKDLDPESTKDSQDSRIKTNHPM